MPIIGLLAVGVSLAIDKYQERQAARNAENDSHDQTSGLETGITSPELERKREEEAFHELQNYANFQEALSTKVLDELSRDDSLRAPYSPQVRLGNDKFTGNQWNDQLKGTRDRTQDRLPCPIIISQKAFPLDGPGWVRTYSPALMDCDIPQQPFLDFLDSFNDSLHFFPDIEAVNIAALDLGIGWRDKSPNLSSAIPNAVELAKNAQQGRDTFIDNANVSLFSPRGLFAMVITSNPNDLSPVLTINVFNISDSGTSDLNMQGLSFGDLDQGQTSLPTDQTSQPSSRRSNRLQKMSTFISDYGDRKSHTSPTSPTSNLPLFSIISNMSNARESKKESRKRRHNRFQRARPTSRSSGVSSEGVFGVTKAGKAPTSLRRMRRDGGDLGQERHIEDADIQTGALYLVIVNDPGSGQNMADHRRIYDETTFNMEAPLDKGKGKNRAWFEQDERIESLPPKHAVNEQYLEGAEEEDLPPRYSSINPQHRARVQAWREENFESDNPIA